MAKKRIIDPAKGYRIHVNTRLHSPLTPTFAEVHAGTPLEDSQWYPKDPDIKDRESRTVRTLDDLLFLMQTGDHARLANSKVIFGTSEIDWKNFFIRQNRDDGLKRFTDLYNRVAKGDRVPCAILFEASERKTIGLWRNKTNASGKKIPYQDVWIKGQALHIDGKNVDFELFHTYMKDGHASFTIPKGQLILATGMAERSYVSPSGVSETVRVYIDNPDATRWVTRKELSTPPPPPKPIPPMVFRREDMGPLD